MYSTDVVTEHLQPGSFDCFVRRCDYITDIPNDQEITCCFNVVIEYHYDTTTL